MRTYINTKTGAVIRTPCELKSGNWREAIPAKPPEKVKKEPKK